jgi:2-(1,2-epoxy-1,2-dihydrophenyl)acetyl-CoA isomerase
VTSETAPASPRDEAGQPTPDASAVVLETSPSGVATVRINRPDAMNALDLDTKTMLRDALRLVADDPAVRCVVLTGTGRAFCVGQDLKQHIELLQAGDASLGTTVVEHYNPIAELLATMDKPVVAALNGVVAGAGAAFALAADFRILVDTAGFNLAFAGIALSCDSGSSWWLPRLVGPAKAKELLLLPRTIPAQECLELGLVTSIVAAEEFEASVAELAERLAAGPTLAYASIRQSVEYALGHSLGQTLAKEASLMELTGRTKDHQAAVAAFVAKERPVFHGR